MYAQLVGYSTLVGVGGAAICFFVTALHREDASFAAQHAALIQMLHECASATLEFMRLCVPIDFPGLPVERDFVRFVQMAFADGTVKDDEAGQELKRQWRLLLQSGVLQSRGILTDAAADGAELIAKHAVLRIPAAMRRCETCGEPELRQSQFKHCSACRAVVYCCKAHQVSHWPAHKAACKASRRGQE